eukprot:TRINITY_DN51392_c0_g1_i1.p1 TRINITY_DN51392_c0_g1~~TRINITY_DN51392_c0_g1_i1.p1  ORF type:complete len:761 (-),score=95.72 TRINITY_DN51392_c0_g1_i1:248-2530(-)
MKVPCSSPAQTGLPLPERPPEQRILRTWLQRPDSVRLATCSGSLTALPRRRLPGMVPMISLLLLPVFHLSPVVAQPTPAPFLGGCDTNITACCEYIRQQAEEACLEYRLLGNDKELCASWVEVAWDACVATCADCQKIGRKLHIQCRYALGKILTDGEQIQEYCDETYYMFQHYRCPAVCEPLFNDNFSDFCIQDQGNDCMATCGAFSTCNCRKLKTKFVPDECDGETVVDGINRFHDEEYSCTQTPPGCMHHNHDRPIVNDIFKPTVCSKYRLCTKDVCIIKNIVCQPPSQCEEVGKCDKGTGECHFRNRPDGYPCVDEYFYTVDDQCVKGYCKGTIDYCLMYNVTCVPLNACVTGGECYPPTGRCTYSYLPDGTPCNDFREYTVEDRCENGLCYGRYVDLCVDWGIVCKAPNVCYEPGTCDPKTGTCSEPTPVDYIQGCDDGDPVTNNDTCIDGICRGMYNSSEMSIAFQTMGEGDCTDRDGVRMATYSGDVRDEAECRAACEGDPQCLAYAYLYPLCRIYGSVRTRAPIGSRTWAFTVGDPDPAVVIETATRTVSGQKMTACRRKSYGDGDKRNPSTQLGDLDDMEQVESVFGFEKLAVFFIIGTFCFFLAPCAVTTWICCCKAAPELDEHGNLVSPMSSPSASMSLDEMRSPGRVQQLPGVEPSNLSSLLELERAKQLALAEAQASSVEDLRNVGDGMDIAPRDLRAIGDETDTAPEVSAMVPVLDDDAAASGHNDMALPGSAVALGHQNGVARTP